VGITVLKHNIPWGPFSRTQIDEVLDRGDITLDSLAQAPGMTEWKPLFEVLVIFETTLPPVPESRALPPVPSPEALRKARLPVPPVFPKSDIVAPEQPVAPMEKKETPLDPAPFFRRGIAFLIDCGILFGPILLFVGLSAIAIELRGLWEHTDEESMRQEWALLERNFHQLLLLVAIGLGWIYAAGLESSRWQATWGKQWMRIKVTDAQGERLSFLRATGRHAAKYLSALPCFLGFMAALFSSRGLAWHDRLADTRVVRHQEIP
jgi:uncharacterized RDD family membrane protein YckC